MTLLDVVKSHGIIWSRRGTLEVPGGLAVDQRKLASAALHAILDVEVVACVLGILDVLHPTPLLGRLIAGCLHVSTAFLFVDLNSRVYALGLWGSNFILDP